jgi:UDP-N-acetylmuramate dehydrogenase
MDIKTIYEKLLQKIPKENILLEELMSKHTSFKVGGPADFFITAENVEQISYILKIAKEENVPLNIIGNGTNLLVKDGGIRGIVLRPKLNYIEKEEKEDSILYTVGSGVMLTPLAQKALEDGLTGLEFAYGIPGTVGGGVLMNAGAFGGELKDIVIKTTYIDYDGNSHEINNQEHQFEYRNSVFSKIKGIIIETQIQLQKGVKEEIRDRMQEILSTRKEKQPTNMPCAGSTFKRGKDYITAKLIDEAGLKGYTIGGAQVSEKHAGFVVNKGGATATDILELIAHIQKEVFHKFNEHIELEIKIMGENK